MIIFYSELTITKSHYPGLGDWYATKFNEPKVTHLYVESGLVGILDSLTHDNITKVQAGSLVRIVDNTKNANGEKTIGIVYEESIFYCIGAWVRGEPKFIENVDCNSNYILDANTYAVVMEGSVEFEEGKVVKADKLTLIKKRDNPLTLHGNARLIVFRY